MKFNYLHNFINNIKEDEERTVDYRFDFLLSYTFRNFEESMMFINYLINIIFIEKKDMGKLTKCYLFFKFHDHIKNEDLFYYDIDLSIFNNIDVLRQDRLDNFLKDLLNAYNRFLGQYTKKFNVLYHNITIYISTNNNILTYLLDE